MEIEPIKPDRLTEYAKIPMKVTVTSVLSVHAQDGGLGGLKLVETPIETPYTKDYDATAYGGPAQWPVRFDVAQWGLWIARTNGCDVGAGAVAWNTPEIPILGGRAGLAVLWDIRVRSEHQGKGIGSRLFQQAEHWALERNCTLLEIETQNVNVPACRFYKKMGCVLGRIDRMAYADSRDQNEVMLVWYKDLRR